MAEWIHQSVDSDSVAFLGGELKSGNEPRRHDSSEKWVWFWPENHSPISYEMNFFRSDPDGF